MQSSPTFPADDESTMSNLSKLENLMIASFAVILIDLTGRVQVSSLWLNINMLCIEFIQNNSRPAPVKMMLGE